MLSEPSSIASSEELQSFESFFDIGDRSEIADSANGFARVLKSPFLGLVFFSAALTARQNALVSEFTNIAVKRAQASAFSFLVVASFIAYLGFEVNRVEVGFVVLAIGLLVAGWRWMLMSRYGDGLVGNAKLRSRAHAELVFLSLMSACIWSVTIITIYPRLPAYAALLFMIVLMASIGVETGFMAVTPPSNFVLLLIVVGSFVIQHYIARSRNDTWVILTIAFFSMIIFRFAHHGMKMQFQESLRVMQARDAHAIVESRLQADLVDTQRKADLTQRASAESKMLFLAKISHEFGTPLSVIINAIDFLDARLEDLKDASLSRTVKNLNSASEQLLHLSVDLATYLRATSANANVAIKPEALELNRFINDCIAVYSDHASKKGLQIRFDAGADRLMCLVDANRLRQIVNNLISNAVKYTERGHITVSAGIQNDGEVTIAVRDTGVGIAPDGLKHVFEPWFRADENKQGFGLGLAIVKATADAIGGKLRIESTLGEGTVVTLTLWLTRLER